MSHATEAECSLAAIGPALRRFARARESISFLDFGCGAGEFSEQVFSSMQCPKRALSIALIEPAQPLRETASARLARFSERPIVAASSLDDSLPAPFDLILSNHALYYVEDLDTTIHGLLASMRPNGSMFVSIAGWDNALLQIWKSGFAQLNRPAPYYAAENVAAVLGRRGIAYARERVAYELRFSDSIENRMKILRFLFAEHLAEMSIDALLAEFDRYVADRNVVMQPYNEHFAIGALGDDAPSHELDG
ncbi:MAG: methyltransferase domain-containing protein [Planctomycetota bacterium]